MITIQENISLKEYTTFDIGGDARYFVEVASVEELKEALAFARENNVEYFVLAGGSNTLFADDGFAGLVIKMTLQDVSFDGARVSCGAGATLLDFLHMVAEHGLEGLENLAGVPGSVGGAVRGNAGAFGCEISDCIESVDVLDVSSGTVEIFSKDVCNFSYRNSVFKEGGDHIIVSVRFSLTQGEQSVIEAQMSDIMEKRNQKQFQNVKSAGSFFINPVVAADVVEKFERDKETKSHSGRVPAGWLLETSGVRDLNVGDVRTGDTHANYFVNEGAATADQVVQLASIAKMRVRNKHGVQLKEEVMLVGF